MNLRRITAIDGSHCPYKASAMQLSNSHSSDQYNLFLELSGLAPTESPLVVAERLKEFTEKELLNNYREYKSKGTNLRTYRSVVSQLMKEEKYSADSGDMVVKALANVLRTYILLTTSSPTCPIMFLRPSKSALSSSPINLVFFSHSKQFAGVLDVDSDSDNAETEEKQKRCRCGQRGTAGCISHSSSCFANRISCDVAPKCWCTNCSNRHGKRGASSGLKTECTCGKNLKTPPVEGKICKTNRCSCFVANNACSTCKCKFCNNPHGLNASLSASNSRTPTKRTYSSKHSGKIPRTPTKQFMDNRGTKKLASHWTLTESILLNEVMKGNIKGRKITANSATKLFNYIIDCRPNLGQKKSSSQITHKWKSITCKKT